MKKQILGFAVTSALLAAGHPVVAQTAPSTPLMVSQSSVGAIAQQFVSTMAMGDFVSARAFYDESVQSSIRPDTLQQSWQDVVAEAGGFQSCVVDESSRLDEPGTSSIVMVTCQFENANRDIFVVFSDNNQVTQFSVGQ